MTLLSEMLAHWCLGVLVTVLGDGSFVATKTSFSRFATCPDVLGSVRTGPIFLNTVCFVDNVCRLAVQHSFDWYHLSGFL